MSNHRDITLDAALLQYKLVCEGFDTMEVTFGANLMQGDFVIDAGKANRMFRVERPGTDMREFYKSSLHLSSYIRHTVTEKLQSVWIAQRNGRTKDGRDRTDQGITRMFALSGSGDRVEDIASLNIVPVAISYEWEPCDVLKALELYASRDGSDAATAEMKRLYSNFRMFELLPNPAANPLKIAEEPAGGINIAGGKNAGTIVPSDSKLSAEVFYHNANPCLIAFIVALLGCLLSFVNLSVKSRKLDAAANICCGATVFVLLAILVARFLIASRPPFANLYEIILWVALFLESFLLGAFIWCKNRTFALIVPVSAMAAGLLFFAKFGLEAGDTFAPIPPVLNASIFLTIHVFTIALGFCGMILSGIVAHLLLHRRTCQPLSSLLYSTLVFGSVFTILGTCLGGVWADFSWGRFWGFDPKECGALFVSIWGMLLLHLRAGRLVKERTFALLACFNVVITFLCWFGINLLGVGLHSYGFQNGTFLGLFAFVFVDVILILLLSCKKYE